MSKGSSRRKPLVSQEKVDTNWDAIFGKKKNKKDVEKKDKKNDK